MFLLKKFLDVILGKGGDRVVRSRGKEKGPLPAVSNRDCRESEALGKIRLRLRVQNVSPLQTLTTTSLPFQNILSSPGML